MKITAVLIVEEIEKSLGFWVDRMGFEKAVEVPDRDRLGFVILTRNGAELMMQTISSVRKDEPKFAPEALSKKVAASLSKQRSFPMCVCVWKDIQ